MTEILKAFAVLLLSTAVYELTVWLDSPFIVQWLSENLLTIIIALLAINIASIGVVVSRLYSLKEDKISNFGRTTNSLRRSLREQIGMIAFVLLANTAKSSPDLVKQHPSVIDAADILTIFMLIWSFTVFYDTTNALLVILEEQS